MHVIDGHTHLNSNRSRGTYQTATALVSRMDRFRLNMSVIMPNPLDTVETVEEPNNLILEARRTHPSRFIGFCCANPLLGERAVKELERCFNLGFRGIGEIVPDAYDIPADHEDMISFVQQTARFNLPILFHSSDTEQSTPKAIEKAVSRFPERTVIIGHMGSWMRLLDDVLSMARRYENVYLDTAFAESPDMVRRALGDLGAQRIIFGSDSFSDEEFRGELGKIRALDLTRSEEELVMGGNVARLVGLAGEHHAR